MLKIAWSNGNLISGSVTSTQASAEVTRNGEDVTGEYAASAFAWKRDSGNAGADNTWNAAHAGKKAITLTAADLSGDVKISCTLTGSGATYGSITVDEDMYASHTPGGLDANDVFAIENGELKVTTSRGEVYALQDGEVKGAGAKLNGSITAQSRLFASQPEDVVEFAYNHDGLRTQKKVTRADGTVETTDYTLHGKLVTHLRRGNDAMHFFYDNEKHPVMVDFNGALYSYIHNLQGDIVGIVDTAGSLVVEYKYDAWGKSTLVRTLTTAYEALAELNPFRYRGYVFDEETGLYYLRSRYYNSECLKFANCDEIYADQSDELFDHNKFAYVNSCPTNRKDEDGFFWHIAIGAIVGGLVGAVGSVISQAVEHGLDFSKIDTGEVVAAGVAGAASGALAATGVGVVGQVVVNAMISGAENVANQTILADEDEEFDPLDLAIDMAIGGLGGAIGGRGASFAKKGTKVVSMTNHVTSLTRRTNRRIIQGLNSRNISVARKAITYYRKNTRVLYRNLRKGLARGFLVSTVYRVGKPLYEHIS